MSAKTTRSDLLTRRALLMAELFLQELEPAFLSRPTDDVGYDLLVGFTNPKGGINTFAVDVKTTTRPAPRAFPVTRITFDRLAYSNIPGLLLVADVKQSRLYYAWLNDADSTPRAASVSVPLRELDEAAIERLHAQLRADSRRVSAAG